MASQTKTTKKTPTKEVAAEKHAKTPTDYQRSSEELRTEALADSPELAFLVDPGKLKRSVRLRLMAKLAVLIGDDDSTDVELDLSMNEHIEIIADATEFIEEHCVIEEHHDEFEAIGDAEAIQVIARYLQMVGERFGSSN